MSNATEKTYLLAMSEKMHKEVKVMASSTSSNMKRYILESVAEKLERDKLKGGAGHEFET